MALFFYIFAILLILSSVMVITSRNPVHAVLWLIFAFCNGSGLMVLMGAEFLAMMLIIIYVGAVAVLFLFVVMMLDIKFSEFKGELDVNMSFVFFIAAILFADLVLVILLSAKVIAPLGNTEFGIASDIGNVYAIGNLLYTEFVLPFQTAGLILFVAMIATITLTHRLRPGVKRQKVSEQMLRSKENSLTFAEVDGKKGLDGLNYDN